MFGIFVWGNSWLGEIVLSKIDKIELQFNRLIGNFISSRNFRNRIVQIWEKFDEIYEKIKSNRPKGGGCGAVRDWIPNLCKHNWIDPFSRPTRILPRDPIERSRSNTFAAPNVLIYPRIKQKEPRSLELWPEEEVGCPGAE